MDSFVIPMELFLIVQAMVTLVIIGTTEYKYSQQMESTCDGLKIREVVV